MARYKDAIQWIADNDDTTELREQGTKSPMTVTMALVADLFKKNDRRVKLDVFDACRKNNAGS